MAFANGQRRAGSHAEARYRRGLRRWQAKTRLILLAAFGPFVAVGVAGLIATGRVLAWSAGVLAGVALGAWVTLRESPPAYIENWQVGAEGERKTERALRPLKRRGWLIVHDVDARYGNYDHIAVGPAGVFLLETKKPQGIVELREGVPVMRRRHDPDATSRLVDIRPKALRCAASLKEEIERRSGRRTWVQAVVVFWCEFPAGEVDDGRCVFVQGSRARAFMRDRPDKLSGTEVAALAATIEELAGDRSASG